MRRIGLLSIVLATSVALGCNSNARKEVSANNPAGGAAVGTAGTDKVTSGDKDFVHDVAIANMAELDVGRLALERATDAEVKKFAQMMIDDHTQAGDKLKAVAAQHNIDVPTQVDDKHKDLRDKLDKRQAADFDREYMSAMVDKHQDLLDKLESRIDKANLSEWKAKMADRPAGTTVQERGKTIAVLPEKSDNPVTMSINQWAAETYPVAHAHLDAAKTLDNTIKRRTTH